MLCTGAGSRWEVIGIVGTAPGPEEGIQFSVVEEKPAGQASDLVPAWGWILLSSAVAGVMWAAERYRVLSSLEGLYGFSLQGMLPLLLLGVVAEIGAGVLLAYVAYVIAERGSQGKRWSVTVYNGFAMLVGSLTIGGRWTQILGVVAVVVAPLLTWWPTLAQKADPQR